MYPLIDSHRRKLDHVAEVVRLRSGHDITFLLEHSVGRALASEHSRTTRSRLPEIEVAGGTLEHIADWLVASIDADLKWLSNVDADGVPKKFSKFSGLADVIAEAARGHQRLLAQHGSVAAVEGEEVVIAELEAGYTIVELKSPQALDRESSHMQHCVGLGGYDEGITNGTISILSLRDAKGRPHATMEVLNRERYVRELKGKQNKFPTDKYFDLLVPWLNEGGLRMAPSQLGAGYFVGDGRIRHIDDLAENDVIDGNLNLDFGSSARNVMFPAGLWINGNLQIKGGDSISRITFGKDITVAGSVTVKDCEIAGLQNLKATQDIQLQSVEIDRIPAGHRFAVPITLNMVTARSDLVNDAVFQAGLRIAGWKTVTLKPSASIFGQLEITSTKKIVVLPGTTLDCDVSINERTLPNIPTDVIEGDLSVGAGVKITGSFSVKGGCVAFGEGFTVAQRLAVTYADAAALPRGLDVGSFCVNTVLGLGEIPADALIRGDVTLIKTDVRDFSTRRRWAGDLRISTDGAVHLPFGLDVAGTLELQGASIGRFPDAMRVGGSLVATRCDGAYIPDGTLVGASIKLDGSTGVRLPDNVTVSGSLHLDKAHMASMPVGVTVAEAVHLQGILVDRITCHFQAASYALADAIIIDMSDLTDIEEHLWISSHDIGHMPEDMNIGGKLIVKGNTLRGVLPNGLSVGEYIAATDVDCDTLAEMTSHVSVGVVVKSYARQASAGM